MTNASSVNISVIILAKNEAEIIGECIDSVKPLNPYEILVIDDHSTDDTSSIAQFKKAKIILHKKKDFAEARNFGLQEARGEWVLYIDADERLSPELAEEINNTLIIAGHQVAAFSLQRVNYFLGKRWPYIEKITRLFRRSKLNKWHGQLHESPKVDGDMILLKHPLIHYTHRSLVEMLNTTIAWSTVEANLRFEVNHPPVSWWRIPRVMAPEFINYYIKQKGWRLGTIGLIESMYQAFSIFITYAKLWQLQQRKRTFKTI